METKLKRISEISQENPKEVFTSIGHLINEDAKTVPQRNGQE